MTKADVEDVDVNESSSPAAGGDQPAPSDATAGPEPAAEPAATAPPDPADDGWVEV